MKKNLTYTPILVALLIAFSCSEKEVAPTDIEIYGELNTITVNFPDGQKVFQVDLAKNTFDLDIYESAHWRTTGGTSNLQIRDRANSFYIIMYTGVYPYPVSKKTKGNNIVYGDMRFNYNGAYYYCGFQDNRDFLQFDVIELGDELIQTGRGDIEIIEEFRTIKGSFRGMTIDGWTTNDYVDMGEITGTIHISNN